MTQQILAKSKMPAPDCEQLYRELALDDGPFTAAQRRDLAQAVASHSRTDQPATAALESNRDVQDHMYVYNYMTDNIWKYVMNLDHDLQSVLNELVSFCQSALGLIKVSDDTARVIVATALRARGETLNPVLAKAKIDMVKLIMKNLRKANHPYATFKTFPASPVDFTNVYTNRYPTGEAPVPCPIDTQGIVDMCRPDVLPCRKTATSLGKAPATDTHALAVLPRSGSGSSPPQQNDMQQMMAAMLQQMMQRMGCAPPAASEPIPDMRYVFQPQGNSPSHAHRPTTPRRAPTLDFSSGPTLGSSSPSDIGDGSQSVGEAIAERVADAGSVHVETCVGGTIMPSAEPATMPPAASAPVPDPSTR